MTSAKMTLEEKLNKVKMLAEDLEKLKIDMANEKALWNKSFGDVANFNANKKDALDIMPVVIQAYEKKMEKYVMALTQAQSEKREEMRRKIAEGAIAQQLAQLGEKCETELKDLEETSKALKNIGNPGETKTEKMKNASGDETDEEWEWDFHDAYEYVD